MEKYITVLDESVAEYTGLDGCRMRCGFHFDYKGLELTYHKTLPYSTIVETDPEDGKTYDILYDIIIKQNGELRSDWDETKLDVEAYKNVKFEPYDLHIIEGDLNPSSDTKTHLELYKAYPELGGIVHTHSPYAVGWAQACEDIPCYGTTHADYFYGDIPCARHLSVEELEEDYEKNTGKAIIECFNERGLDPKAVPGVICASHGPFTWGKDAAQAVYHAVVMEEVAKMARLTVTIKPEAAPAPQHVQDKHYMRKHGPNAYYGQK